MNPLTETQELARRFNEDEAVWHAFEDKCAQRQLLRSGTPLSEDTLDYLDWQAAERECRVTSAIGVFHP